jgi:large subunit ribosomal protein L9
MPIEIILKEHVEHLGRRGEIVKVADGYARNYLFPRKLALAVTVANKRLIERERAKAEARDAEEQMTAQALATRIEAVELAIARRVGENDTLYGSVTSADIAEALAERGLPVDRRRIQLADPLKALGDHAVPVKLHREVTAQIKVKIVPASS